MRLSKSLLKIMQETNDISQNPLLAAIDINFIEEMEKESSADPEICKIISKMEKLIRDINIQDFDELRQVYTTYGQAKFYKELKNRFSISTVPEKKGRRTPDFKILCGEREFYAEVKSFMMSGGDLKYKTTMDDATDAQIDAEKQLHGGKCVGIGEQIIQPHLKNNRDYDSFSIRIIIENLIDKFSQNYKDEQYNMGDTISFVYLNEYNFTLYGSGSNKQKIIPFYFDHSRRAPVSGELWTAAFGKIGMPVFKSPEFEGAKNRDGELNDNGILVKFPEPKGVCFYIEALNHHGEIVALIRYGEDKIEELISKVTELYNDDQNSRTYHLM